MRETDYVNLLYRFLDPGKHPQVAREIIHGLSAPLPDYAKARFAEQLWGWTCNDPPAPDLLLGDHNDRGLAAFEFKAPGTAIQWTSRGALRGTQRRGTDEVSRRVFDHYLADTKQALDAPHLDEACVGPDGCEDWKWGRDGQHFPAAHQGDVYASTLDYVPANLTVDSPRDLTLVFVAPTESSANRWMQDLQSHQQWHVVHLPKVLDHWRHRLPAMPDLTPVVNATDKFLHTTNQTGINQHA